MTVNRASEVEHRRGRAFSLPTYHRITPDLTPTQRLSVFLALPDDLRHNAWHELRERIERDVRAQFAEYRLGGSATAGEIAAEIAAIWPEIEAVPLAGVSDRPANRCAPRQARPTAIDPDLDRLRAIPSADYVPMLTGRPVHRGFACCPFHAGGEERTASLHASANGGEWHCFGCGAGGDVFEFFAALRDQDVPNGGEFFDFAGELAAVLLAGVR